MIDSSQVIQLYQSGLSCRGVASQVGIHPATVSKIIRKNGITPRSCGRYIQEICKRGHALVESNILYTVDRTGRTHRACKACNYGHQPVYRKQSWAHRYQTHRIWMMKNRYGLTPEKYQERFDKQAGKCALPSCGKPINAIDHDHATNTFRGLLCKEHNSALGLFSDNPTLLREAATYIEAANSGA